MLKCSCKGKFGKENTCQDRLTEHRTSLWNGKPAKVDIREWDPEHEHMSRGITLRKSEALKLLDILLRNFGRELSDIRAKAAAEAAKAVEEIEASTASHAAADAEPIEPMEPMDEAETESMQSPF